MRDIVAARDVGEGFAIHVASVDSLALLMRDHLRFAGRGWPRASALFSSSFAGAGADPVALEPDAAAEHPHHPSGRAVSRSRQRCSTSTWWSRVTRSPQRRGGRRKRHTRAALMKPPGDDQSGVLLVGLLAPANRDQ